MRARRLLTGPNSIKWQSCCVCMVERDDPRRPELESFVADRYESQFGAQLHEFFPTISEITDNDGLRIGAVGIRLAKQERLFSEAYIDQPIESLLTLTNSYPVQRDGIVEFGNFVTLGPGYNRVVIPVMAALLEEMNLEWTVFTLTRTIRNSFRRLGVSLQCLAEADPEKLNGAAVDWGQYYNHSPVVSAVPVAHGLVELRRHTVGQPRPQFTRRASNWFASMVPAPAC